ncbi:MAG: LysR family hydrogen peroxide-inducible transcriptional activator [Arenicella sp.]|jgi:LysR family hydrogen peroxide-inducible transcriptional activator
MISFKQLNYALAVEKHLHFKRAAESCSVSQSALSTALTQLETQLGFQIFERDNKKVLVTPIGKKVLEKAQSIKLQLDDLYKLADAQRSELSYPMSIGIIPTIAPYLLPIVLPELSQQYPNLELRIVEEQSHILVDKVRRGEIDTAILALPYACDGLLSFEFWHEDFYWITHSDEMRSGCTEITANELQQSNLMLLQDGHCLKDQALSACKFPSDAKHSVGATSLNTLIQLVAGKLGTTLVPAMALEQLIENNPLLSKARLSEPGPHRRIAFIVRPNYTGVNNIELLMTQFKASLQQHFKKTSTS